MKFCNLVIIAVKWIWGIYPMAKINSSGIRGIKSVSWEGSWQKEGENKYGLRLKMTPIFKEIDKSPIFDGSYIIMDIPIMFYDDAHRKIIRTPPITLSTKTGFVWKVEVGVGVKGCVDEGEELVLQPKVPRHFFFSKIYYHSFFSSLTTPFKVIPHDRNFQAGKAKERVD